jgi:hypothetical protein
MIKVKMIPIYLLLFLFVFFNINAEFVYAQNDIRIIAEYRFIDSDVEPVVINERTIVPIRTIVEALDLNIQYQDGVITINNNKKQVILYINNDAALVDNETIFLDVPAYIENGRTMVPLRFVAESLGVGVHWDAADNCIFVGTDSYSELYTLTYASGVEYEGQIKDGEYNGFGKLIWPDGSYYEGEWANGLYNGNGIYFYCNKDKYIGEFKNGKKHGKGTYTYSNGQEVMGNWYKGKLSK